MAKSVKIKAIIKHCKLEGGAVVYFKSGKHFFKMTSKKDVRLSACNHIASLMQNWKRKSIISVVYEDEQVLLDGKPVHLTNTLIDVTGNSLQFLGIEHA